jgi:uncharacterized repeat protein (TIGR03803 family)
LVQASDGNLYGATEDGGTNGDGTVFRISTNGAEAVVYSFTGGEYSKAHSNSARWLSFLLAFARRGRGRPKAKAWNVHQLDYAFPQARQVL